MYWVEGYWIPGYWIPGYWYARAVPPDPMDPVEMADDVGGSAAVVITYPIPTNDRTVQYPRVVSTRTVVYGE